MSFYSEKFLFNDISNEEMGVILVTMQSDVLMEYGIKYKEPLGVDMSKVNHFYYSQNTEIEPITITLALVDINGNPTVWTREDKRKVIDWFVTDTFCPFVSGDDPAVLYYLKCIEYNRKFNSNGQGVIEFTMQPENQYVYTPVIESTYSVKGEKQISINNLSNVTDKYYPKIEVIQYGKEKEDIIIENLSVNNEPFVIKNLEENEKVEVDHLLKSIVSNKELFKLKDINRKWVYFKRGLNNIRVYGDCDIKIIAQYPLKV